MSFLIEQCTFFELTEDVLATCQPFSCGNADLDDFFLNDATRYAHFLMGKKEALIKLDTRLMYFDLLKLRQEV